MNRRRPTPSRGLYNRRNRPISPCSKGLNSKFTLLRNSPFRRVYAIELTALQFSDLRVTVLRTPARLNVSLTSHVYTWNYQMTNIISRFVKDESGATAIEYALIAGGLSIVIVAAVNLVGTSLNGTFNGVAALLAP